MNAVADKFPELRACLAPRGSRRHARGSAAFTLIELILVMTILTIAISVAAPALANFFRGRSLDSEARRLLAMARNGQSRAVSEGVPMELWFDVARNAFGLEAEPSYEAEDPKATTLSLDSDTSLEVGSIDALGRLTTGPASIPLVSSGRSGPLSRHPDLPRIRFLPDGSISEISPSAVRLTRRDGGTLWLVQTPNRLSYELRAQLQ